MDSPPTRLPLSFIAPDIERTRPLLDGVVQPEGITLITTRSMGNETFWRQLKFQEYDISAMSISSYIIAKLQGIDMVAIPVFPSRRFMHSDLSYHVDSGIKQASDLVGKKIGVGEYQQTAALWVRGTLEHDFGVSQYKVDWYMERTEELSHGGATHFTPPPGISFQRLPPEKSLASALVHHEIDVASVHRAFLNVNSVIDRSTQIRARSGDWSKVKPLFPDKIEEGTRYFKKHGYIPANNIYTIRGELQRKHPWVAFNLYKAFLAAKQVAQERLVEDIPSALVFGPEYLAKTREIFGPDPYPYGMKANQRMLDDLVSFSYEQGLIPRKPEMEELFAPSTLDL
jgi:4,5-dihydroxyphthalate decarboxylase